MIEEAIAVQAAVQAADTLRVLLVAVMVEVLLQDTLLVLPDLLEAATEVVSPQALPLPLHVLPEVDTAVEHLLLPLVLLAQLQPQEVADLLQDVEINFI